MQCKSLTILHLIWHTATNLVMNRKMYSNCTVPYQTVGFATMFPSCLFLKIYFKLSSNDISLHKSRTRLILTLSLHQHLSIMFLPPGGFWQKRQERIQSTNNVLEKNMPKEGLKCTQWVLERWEGFHPCGFSFLHHHCIAKHTHKRSASLEQKSSGFDLTKLDIKIF